MPTLPTFEAPYAPDDAAIVAGLLGERAAEPQAEARIDERASRLIEAIRDNAGLDRRRRGLPARVRPVDPRGAGADGARRGAAARAGRRDRRTG